MHICCLQLRRPAAPLAQYWHSTQAGREEIVPLPRSGCETVRIRCRQKGTRDHSPILLSAETGKQLRATRSARSGSWKEEQASISLQCLSSNVKRPFFAWMRCASFSYPLLEDVGGEDTGRFCCRITTQATIATSGMCFQSKSQIFAQCPDKYIIIQWHFKKNTCQSWASMSQHFYMWAK